MLPANEDFALATFADDNYVAVSFHGLEHEGVSGVFGNEVCTGAGGATWDN